MRQFKFIMLVIVATVMVSCNKTQDEATGVGDAIIIVKKSGTDAVYGYSLYAYSFSPFKSVTAELVNNIIADHAYILDVNQSYKTNFYYEPTDAEFTTTKPVASTFKFSAVFENGATDEFQDEVTDQILTVPSIDKTEYNATSKELGITWTSVTGADSYGINILEGEKVVYGSPELLNTVKYYPVSSTSGWVKDYPVAGKTYTVRLNAYLYEPSGNSYNIQAVAIAEKTNIKWGE